VSEQDRVQLPGGKKKDKAVLTPLFSLSAIQPDQPISIRWEWNGQ